MKRRLYLLLAVAIGCNTPPPPSPPPVQEPPAPSHAAAKTVTISSPSEGETVRRNPIVIKGTARTFENAVAVRILDSRGAVLAEEPTIAIGEMGSFNPWSAEIHLTSIPSGAITVEAVDLSAKDGSVVSRAWVTAPFDVEPREAQIFFSSQTKGDQCVDVYAVTRTMPKSLGAARLLVEALLAGPTAEEQKSGFISPFPEGSGVKSVNLKDGVVTVDFNERLRNVGGSCRVSAIQAVVEKTLKTLPGVKRVEITAAGSRELALQP